METDAKIQYAIEHTRVVRPPKQSLATFGSTNVYYYLITDLMETANVVREGRVIAARPKIVTPNYLINLEGFSGQAKRYIEMLADKQPFEPGIFYSYKNEPKEMNIVSSSIEEIVNKINQQIDAEGNPLAAIIKGIEDMWDVSLLKFTYELTRNSLHSNVMEMERSGLFRMDDAGVPADARNHIEELFAKTRQDHSWAPRLIAELRRWNLFNEYQDRFLSLFKK